MREQTYIHELEDWPRVRWDAAAIAEPLASVRHVQGRLAGRMAGLGFALRDEARLAVLTEDAVQTSSIEGERLDPEGVRSSIARRLGMDTAAMKPVAREAEGLVAMLIDATARADESLTAERIWGWHAALFPTGYSGLRRVRTGAWRDDAAGPMEVVSGAVGQERVHFEAPAAELVSDAMAEFLAWFDTEDGLDLVLKAALAHLRFVTVHPLDDGNGRVARALADMLLARAEGDSQRFYSMSAQIRKERAAYYEVLEQTQKGGMDVTVWMLWFLGCLERAIGAAQGTVAAVLEKARFWEDLRNVSLNARQRLMLNRLLDGFAGKLTTSKWAKIAKCSQDTALRDIRELVELGVLSRGLPGGRSTSYSLARDVG